MSKLDDIRAHFRGRTDEELDAELRDLFAAKDEPLSAVLPWRRPRLDVAINALREEKQRRKGTQ